MVLRILLFLVCVLTTGLAFAQDVIGLSLPLSGRLSPVAEHIEFGALAAVKKLQAEGRGIRLVLVNDGCNERRVPEAAEMLRSEGAKIVVGLTCFEVARQLAASLNGENGNTVPIIALNTRNPLLGYYRPNEDLPLYEIANAPDAEAQAVVDKIFPRFEGKPFAILNDGSVYGRGLSERLRLLGQDAGYTPIETADFRPFQTTQTSILRRLQRSGVEALFLAASPEDIVTIASDLKALQYDWIIGTGETGQLLPFALNAGVIPDGLLMVRPQDLPTSNATELLENLTNDEVEVEDSLLLGHMLIEVAAAAIEETPAKLEGRNFETVIGPVTFGNDGRAMPVPFGLYEWRNGAFEPAAER